MIFRWRFRGEKYIKNISKKYFVIEDKTTIFATRFKTLVFKSARTRNVPTKSGRFLRKRCNSTEVWIKNDSVAQPVEHYTFNVGVLGSNPSGITETKVKRHQSRSSFNTRAAFLFLGTSYRLKQTQTFCE